MFTSVGRSRRGTLYGLIYAGGAAGLLSAGYWQLSSGQWASLDLRWAPMIAAAVAQVLAAAVGIEAWRNAVHASSHVKLPWHEAALHVCLTLVAKYIPGKFWGLAIRHQMVSRTTDDPGGAGAALAVEQLGFLAAAGALSIPALLIVWTQLPLWTWYTFAAAALVASLVLAPGTRRKLETMVPRVPELRAVRRGALICGFQWLLTASSAVLVAEALQVDRDFRDSILLASAVPAAYLVGLAAFFAPAGIGVREGAFVFLCAPHIGAAEAFACALTLRILVTLRDALCGLAIPALSRVRKLLDEV